MITILAPHALPQTAITLPSPVQGDSEGLGANVVKHVMMDGSLRTYVRRQGTRILEYSFILSREKAEELTRFIESYAGEVWRIYDYKGEMWIGSLLRDTSSNQIARQVTVNLELEVKHG